MGDAIPAVSIEDQVACVRREIRMRERVYPRWVAEGRMTPKKAAEETAAMAAVLGTLEEIAAKGLLI